MAKTLWVDGDNGSDTNSGSREDHTTLENGESAATTAGNATVDLSGDAPTLGPVNAGDTITIDGRTDGLNGTDVFRITIVDADSVDVTPTPSSSNTGQFWRIGGAFKTIQRAVDVSEADTIYVQNNGATVYAEPVSFDGSVVGGRPLILIAYGTSVDDLTMVDWDASGLTNAATFSNTNNVLFPVFCNFDIHGSTSDLMLAGDQNTRYKFFNCKLRDSGGSGFNANGGNNVSLYMEFCDVFGNAGDGLSVGPDSFLTVLVHTPVHDNSGVGVDGDTGPSFGMGNHVILINSPVYDNATNVEGGVSEMYGGTVDNAGGTNIVTTVSHVPTIVGTGITNAGTYGINNSPSGDIGAILVSVGFFQNTSGDLNLTPLFNVNPITAQDPLYNDPVNDDYTLQAASPWLQQAIQVGTLT